MGIQFKLLLGYLLVIVITHVATRIYGYEYNLSDLLKNQVNHQITLAIPEYYYGAYDHHGSAALDQAIDFLAKKQAPSRLVFNETKTIRAPAVSPLARYVTNQEIWLVFVVVETESENIDLLRVLWACTVDAPLGPSAIINKHLIQVVLDQSAFIELWDGGCQNYMSRQFVPLYILLLSWSDEVFTTSDAALLRETCACDDASEFVVFTNYFLRVAESNGVEGLLDDIREMKKDFRGRRAQI